MTTTTAHTFLTTLSKNDSWKDYNALILLIRDLLRNEVVELIGLHQTCLMDMIKFADLNSPRLNVSKRRDPIWGMAYREARMIAMWINGLN